MCSQTSRPGTIVAICATCLALILLSVLIVSRTTLAANPETTSTIEAGWHTFLGSEPASPSDSDDDLGYDVATDTSGQAYAVGQSIDGDWGTTPIISHALGLDGFLAKLDDEGTLLWHTFVGGSESDSARAIAIDDADNLFVVGTSTGGDWGSEPISAAHGYNDLFVARFDENGTRQWFTFVGTGNQDYGQAIALDDAGHIYAGGVWIVNPYLAKLNSTGQFQWQRVITSTSGDLGAVQGIATDQSGDVYLAGLSKYGDWYGAPPPVNPHSGSPGQSDIFVAKLDGADGALLWHTFLGAADWEDEGQALVIQDGQGPPAVYMAGWSSSSWGTPLAPYNGASDAVVAQLNGDDGSLVWNTFMGNRTYGDRIHAIVLDDEQRLFVAGTSRDGWGSPVIPHPGGGVGDAAFVAALAADGSFLGNTFIGGTSSSDEAFGIAASVQGDLYVSGSSWSPDSVGWNNPLWGPPIRPFSGTHDAFVAGLGPREVIRYRLYLPIMRTQ